MIPNLNKQIAFNFLLAILRISLSVASVPLLVRSVGLEGDLNVYYAATAMTNALFNVVIMPIEISYAPWIASALKLGSPESLRQQVEKKIGASALLLALLIGSTVLYQILIGLFGAPMPEVAQAWFYLVCFVNSCIQYQLLQFLSIMRYEKRLISASCCSILGVLVSSILPVLIIPSHGLVGFVILSALLAVILNALLFIYEKLDLTRVISYWPDKRFAVGYLKLIKMCIFTKGFAIAESVAINLFALQDSTLYFLTKKIANQFLSVFIEGRIRFLEADIVHAIGNGDNLLALSVMKSNANISHWVCLCYLGSLAIVAFNASFLSHLMQITLNQVQFAFWLSAILVLWLYSSVKSTVLLGAFYSLDLAIRNRFLLISSALVWALATLIATFMFGAYATALSVCGYSLFNQTVITRKVSLALT